MAPYTAPSLGAMSAMSAVGKTRSYRERSAPLDDLGRDDSGQESPSFPVGPRFPESGPEAAHRVWFGSDPCVSVLGPTTAKLPGFLGVGCKDNHLFDFDATRNKRHRYERSDRTLLGAPGRTTSNKNATSSKDATRGSWPYY